jgi:hypothetical protein
MKAVRIFNPLHVMGNKIVVGDIDNLKLFKLSQRPDIRPRLEGIKQEISKYNAMASGIMSLDERKDVKGMTHLSCVIGGGASLENFQTLLLCCVQC